MKYLTSECNYGGRVTDDKDRRLIITLLEDYYNTDLITNKNYLLAPNPIYKIPDVEKHEEFVEHIRALPFDTHPEVFGFHANANITKEINETNILLDSVLACSS